MTEKKCSWAPVTIVFVNYNNKEMLKKSIENILCETAEDIEILVIDNDSKDGSIEYIENHYSRVYTERLENNMGFGKGCNRGMEIAFEKGSQFVMLLNTDTEVEEGMISELLKYCNDNTLVIPRMYTDEKDKNNSLWYSGGKINFETAEVEQTLFKYDIKDDECNLPKKVEFATGCCMMISKAIWEKVGGFAEEYFLYYEDVDYSMRLKECGINILYVPKAALWHKVGGSAGGEISATSLYYTVRNRLIFADKYKKYLKYDVMEVLKIIMEYFTSPYNLKYETIVLSAIKDYMKGVRGKEKNHIHENYTIVSGFFDVEGEEGNWYQWCGSPKAEIEIYNSNGEQEGREMRLSFTLLPPPLKENVHLNVMEEGGGAIKQFMAGDNQLRLWLKPYEKKTLQFCTDEMPTVGFKNDVRNLFYQISNMRVEVL